MISPCPFSLPLSLVALVCFAHMLWSYLVFSFMYVLCKLEESSSSACWIINRVEIGRLPLGDVCPLLKVQAPRPGGWLGQHSRGAGKGLPRPTHPAPLQRALTALNAPVLQVPLQLRLDWSRRHRFIDSLAVCSACSLRPVQTNCS